MISQSAFALGRSATMICVLFLAVSHATAAELRIWTDTHGGTLEAEFVRQVNGAVMLITENGSTKSLPLENLSREDQQWIQQYDKDRQADADRSLLDVPEVEQSAPELERGRLGLEPFRTWTDYEGNTIEGRVVGYANGFVTIQQKVGQPIELRPNQFSESDIAYLKEIFTWMHVTPRITIPPNPTFDQRRKASLAMVKAEGERRMAEFEAQSADRLGHLDDHIQRSNEIADRTATEAEDRADQSEDAADRAEQRMQQMMADLKAGKMPKRDDALADFGSDQPSKSSPPPEPPQPPKESPAPRFPAAPAPLAAPEVPASPETWPAIADAGTTVPQPLSEPSVTPSASAAPVTTGSGTFLIIAGVLAVVLVIGGVATSLVLRNG